MDRNHESTGDQAESTGYESPQRWLLTPEELRTHSQGSQCLGDVTSSLGEEFQPHVASEELVPMGNTQLLRVKNPRPKRWASEPSLCVCVCAHESACECARFEGCVSSVQGPRYWLLTLCLWRVVRTLLCDHREEMALMDGLSVCSRPNIFLKDSPSTKFCSKPTICKKHSLVNYGVSSFGMHARIVWLERAGHL